MELGPKTADLLARDEQSLADCMKIRILPLVMAGGEGSQIVDVDGKRYIDFSGNWAVANTGYGHPAIVEAIRQQAADNLFSSTCTVLSEPVILLAERLQALTPGDFKKKVWFGLSGSDASECIAKLLPLATGRRRILSFFGSYHGSTAGSLSLSGHTSQARFIPSPNVVKIPYPNPYRPPPGAEGRTCGQWCLDYLEHHVFTTICPPDDVAACMFEPIQCDGGVVVPPDGFLRGLADLCARHGIALVVDEVKVGLGRTGKMFAIEHEGVVPDALALAKPLGGGIPLSAVVARSHFLDVAPASHLLTMGGSPLACRAALATLDVITQEKLADRAVETGRYLIEQLESLEKAHPLIGDVRGRGLAVGVELVRNRETKEPAPRETAKLCLRAYELGLILFYVGVHSNVLELTPPLSISREEVDRGVAILDQALSDVEAGLVPDEVLHRFAGW